MIKFNKPGFWDKKEISFFSAVLFPFTLIVLFYIFFKKTFLKPVSFKIPVICVGNIYLGGTGKTPTSILIAKELSNLGYKAVILRKFYKSHSDEYNLIKYNYNNLIISEARSVGIIEAEKKGFDAVILDDGLQDYKIRKKLNIVCFNQNQHVGNGFVLPAGPLREKLDSLKNANIILIIGSKDEHFEKKILKINSNIEIYYSYYSPLNIDKFKNKKLLALAGIANPENFFLLLEKNKLNICEKIVFPDHYKFTKNEIQNIIRSAKLKGLEVIMTEKDFFKVNNFGLSDLNYLKVSLNIINKQNLINKIKKYL